MKKEKVCILCGSRSPNPYGECGCSYNIKFFQDAEIFNFIKKLDCKVIPLFWKNVFDNK